MYTGFTLTFTTAAISQVISKIADVLKNDYDAVVDVTDTGLVTQSINGSSTADYEVSVTFQGGKCTVSGWGNGKELEGQAFIDTLTPLASLIDITSLAGCWEEDDADEDFLEPERYPMESPASWGLRGTLLMPPLA